MRLLKIREGVNLEMLGNEESCLSLENVFLGITTKRILNRKINEGDITQTQSDTCLHGAQAFYRHSLGYILKKMDMSETLWVHAMVIAFFKKKDVAGYNII